MLLWEAHTQSRTIIIVHIVRINQRIRRRRCLDLKVAPVEW